ncbi:MAG: hypothetical protein MJ132_06940 [Clostridia bacterium]|nr:hypothetical protein [Clostridia bacterium]
MNRLFLSLMLCGAVFTGAACDLPVEEAQYCREWHNSPRYETRSEGICRPFDLFAWEYPKKADDF